MSAPASRARLVGPSVEVSELRVGSFPLDEVRLGQVHVGSFQLDTFCRERLARLERQLRRTPDDLQRAAMMCIVMTAA